jgi:hypothetical protein
MDTLMTGAIVSLLTQGAKKLQAIPISSKQVGRIRILGLILSGIGTIAVAYGDGNLASLDFQSFVGETANNWITSVLMYYGFFRSNPQPEASA